MIGTVRFAAVSNAVAALLLEAQIALDARVSAISRQQGPTITSSHLHAVYLA